MSHLDEGTLAALLDGEIPSAEIPALQAHLELCASCQQRLAEARGLRDQAFALVASLDLESAPSGVADPAVRAAAVPRKRARPGWERDAMRVLAWAASVVLAAGGGYLVGGGPDSAREADRPAALPVTTAALDSAARAEPAARSASVERQREPVTPPQLRELAAADERADVSRDRELSRELASDRPEAGRAAVAKVADSAVPTRGAVDSIGAHRKLRETKDDAAKRVAAGEARPASPIAQRAMNARTEVLAADLAAAPPAEAAIEASPLDAIRLLGGTLRLIEGLIPERFELAARTVRVHYVTAVGSLVLEQWREGDAIRTRIVAGPRTPADSVAVWGRRVK
jgi:hypothetical protein